VMRVTVHGYYGKKNTGDELILNVLGGRLSSLKKRFNLNIGILPSLGVDQAYSPPIEGVNVLPYVKPKFLSRLGIFPEARRTDLLILGGGGIIQDHEDAKSGPIRSLLKRAILVRIFGGKIILLGVGVSELKTKMGLIQTKILGFLSEFIVTRDTKSADRLKGMGISSKKIHCAGDFVSLWNPPEEVINGDVSEGSPYFVVSVLPYHKELREVSEKTNNIRKAIAESLDRYVEKTNQNVVFLSFQDAPKDYDKEESENICMRMKNKNRCTVKNYMSPDETFIVIKKSKMVIGMRLHSIVLACLARIPFVAIGYHSKVSEFVNSINPGTHVILRDELPGGLLDKSLDELTNPPVFSGSENFSFLRNQAEINFKYLG